MISVDNPCHQLTYWLFARTWNTALFTSASWMSLLSSMRRQLALLWVITFTHHSDNQWFWISSWPYYRSSTIALNPQNVSCETSRNSLTNQGFFKSNTMLFGTTYRLSSIFAIIGIISIDCSFGFLNLARQTLHVM